jgi:DnaJ like chaperone protein
MMIGRIIGALFFSVLLYRMWRVWRIQRNGIDPVFFESAFLVMGAVAKADGVVSEKSIRAALRMIQRFALNADLKREAVRFFRLGTDPAFDLEKTLSDFIRQSQSNAAMRKFFMEIQCKAAKQSGSIGGAKSALLAAMSHRLGVSHADAGHHGFSNTLQEAYHQLGISMHATNAAIKEQYRRLMNQHHPDKLMAKGLGAHLIKAAEQKTQAIRNAYERIREARNFR